MRYCIRCVRVELKDGETYCTPCAIETVKVNANILPRLKRDRVKRERRPAGYSKNRTWKYMRIRRTNSYMTSLMTEARSLGSISPSLRRY